MHLNIGDNLKEYRKKFNLNQQAIADQLNIDRSTYSCYEINKTYPPLDTLIRISKLFNVSVDELIGYERPTTAYVSESTPPYESVPASSLTPAERTILMKLRELDSESLKKVTDLIEECLGKMD